MPKRDFPETVKTQRLVLRGYGEQDAAGILQLVRQNRARMIRDFRRMSTLQNFGDARSFVAERQELWKLQRAYCYGIWREGESEQVGQIQVKNISWDVPSAELGYFIGEAWRRRGYASEGIRMTFFYLLQHLQPLPFSLAQLDSLLFHPASRLG